MRGRVRRVFRKSYVHKTEGSDYTQYRWEYYVEVAGVEKEVMMECVPDFAETAEDFAKGNIHQYYGRKEHSTEEILKDCFGSRATIERYEPTRTSFYWRAKRYRWDGIKPVPYNLKAINLITFDGDHFHMEIEKDEPNTWPDEESCRRDNKPPVVEFDHPK